VPVEKFHSARLLGSVRGDSLPPHRSNSTSLSGIIGALSQRVLLRIHPSARLPVAVDPLLPIIMGQQQLIAFRAVNSAADS
jgi:hypothetical protein